ncbi:MAG: DNA gyrase C-terminal beta-propeller domain-containing protein, partial [Thermoanaerobaculia bacterium]
HLFVASAHSYVLVFTQSGRVYWIKVHEIPQAGPAAKGKAIVNLLNLEGSDAIATTIAVRDFADDRFLVFATEKGTIKKTALSQFGNPRAGGIIAINLEEGDRLLSVKSTDGTKHLFLATANGMSIRFPESDCRPMGRATGGVRGISLRKGDRVIGMDALEKEGAILTAAERGIGKRTPIEEYREQGRGGLGVINLKVSAKTGKVVGIAQVLPGDQLILITHDGMIIRTAVDGIREIGRSTQGVRLINLDGDDRLVAIAKVLERDDDAEGLAELPADDASDEPDPQSTLE